jgi:hypothetical protein
LQPKKTAAAFAFVFWFVVAIAILIYAMYLSFTHRWWWLPLGLFAAAGIIRANSSAGTSNLLDAAMVDSDFYEKIAQHDGWLYRMNEEDAEPYLTEDYRLGQDALRRFEAGLSCEPE